MSKGRLDLTPCHEPRRKFCLLNEDGKCRALNDTNFKHDSCPFYKDKRQMDPEKVGQYQEGCEFGFIQMSKYMNPPEDKL